MLFGRLEKFNWIELLLLLLLHGRNAICQFQFGMKSSFFFILDLQNAHAKRLNARMYIG